MVLVGRASAQVETICHVSGIVFAQNEPGQIDKFLPFRILPFPFVERLISCFKAVVIQTYLACWLLA